MLIAHNGAISANLIFLANLATAIVCDVFSLSMGSTRMEQDGHLYSALGHIRVMYYMVKANEVVDAGSHQPGASPTAVNVTRMVQLVRVGLEQTSKHLSPGHRTEHRSAARLGGTGALLTATTYRSTTAHQLGARLDNACMYTAC